MRRKTVNRADVRFTGWSAFINFGIDSGGTASYSTRKLGYTQYETNLAWGPCVKSVRVFLVEDSPVFRSALRSLLCEQGLAITGANGMSGHKAGGQPDVVLVDVGTFAQNAQALEELVREYARVAPVLLLTREDRLEMLLVGLKGGAVGFVEQSASMEELQKAILALAEGHTWCDVKAFQKVMSFLPVLPYSKQLQLTEREEEVLKHVSLGQSNKEIAAHLGLSPQSVKVYVSNLLRKSGVSNRSGLTHYAVARTLARTQPSPKTG